MTASKLQAENHELRERLRDLVNVGRRNLEMSDQIAALIKENHRLVDTVFKKQQKIDEFIGKEDKTPVLDRGKGSNVSADDVRGILSKQEKE